MARRDAWKEAVGAVLRSLSGAPDAAARETGKVWQWAFERLHTHPTTFSQLQEANPDKLDELVKEFLKIAEAGAGGGQVADAPLVERAIQY